MNTDKKGAAGPCALIATLLMLSGCSTVRVAEQQSETNFGHTYVPIDAFPVSIVAGANCDPKMTITQAALLEALPDNSIRMFVQKLDSKGSVTFGSSSVGVKGESYKVTVDYINADTIGYPVWVAKTMWRQDRKIQSVPLSFSAGDSHQHLTGNVPLVLGSEEYDIRSKPPERGEEIGGRIYQQINIPVYVGLGLRVSAVVDVVGSTAGISGLGVIGAEAEANKLKGSLVVQTLGISGKAVTAALPIQNELNRTTAQNAIVAVASIKALLHSEDTTVSARVVGMYLPVDGGQALINAIISHLAKDSERTWNMSCPPARKK